jgi:hypothetical protein
MGDVAVAFAVMAHLGIERLKKSGDSDPEMLKLLNDWLEKLRTTWAYFDPELDGYVDGHAERRRHLMDLIDNCLQDLDVFGQYVKASFLNELLKLRDQGALQSDYESSRLRATIQQVRELVEGEPAAV